ncbi:hypothetical protein T07_2852 [Trichinella nelsoni]|uniref:Apple domain-containing protein n=1 Tax=Trichinella nelsoni TaxID=6336 RepID=A0A0V0REM5_9BILA|nr:hypothetical protein T07_2852 [Trichinella nelsoni]
MQKCYFNTSYLLFCAFCSLLQVSFSSEKKIYVPQIDKICSIQKIGIRQEFLNSIGIFLSAASLKYCIAYSYSDFSAYNYSIVVHNEKARSCSPLYDIQEEDIIDNCSEQLHDLQFYKVTHCLPAEGFMSSFEEEFEENVNKIHALKLKATAETCIVERHPFSENFMLKRTGMLFLQSLELCLAHCRVLSVGGKCNAVLFSDEENVCLLLRQNQPLQSRDVIRKSESQFFTLNYCYYNMTESSESTYYNGSGKIINLRIGSMQVQCTVHEIPLRRVHTKLRWLLWNSKTFLHCIKFCAQQFRINLCNAVYFEAEEKTCLHLLLNASEALYEYSESKKETVHFIEKCEEVAEQQEYQQEFAINHIQSDETSISSPSRPISSTTHNVREQQPDFFHYVAAENVEERYMPTHMQKAYFMYGNTVLTTTSPMQKNIRRTKQQFNIDRPDERKCNTEPLIYYFEETQEICAVEIYKQKNLTSWEVMTINKDVTNFQECLLKCIINNECNAINYFPTKECYLIKAAEENHIFIVKDNSIFAEELYCESGTLVDFPIK